MEQQQPSRTHTQEDIAELAYRIWQEEGQPDDKADEHWHRAEEQLRAWHSPVPPEGEAGLPPAA